MSSEDQGDQPPKAPRAGKNRRLEAPESIGEWAGDAPPEPEAGPPDSNRDRWLELAPKPRPLAAGQKWHVYLSYRSVNRPWVLQLYDVLKTLGYEIFLDQYVLTASSSLVRSLEEGLDGSASAVLVWSSASQDSKWGEREFQVLESLTYRNQQFHFVVVKLDKSPLPIFLANRLYIDFSESREGPSGTGLLQLLYGLQGEPLPPEAVKLAAQVDAEIRDSMAMIQAARSLGNPQRLVQLAGSDTLAWHTSPVLLCQVADALIALRENDRALAVIEQCRERFPKAVRPRQLQGLALARKGDLENAQLILGKLYSEGERDSETLAIFARTWMDRYRATNNISFLRRSRDLYAEAFQNAPDDYYVGLNAASKSALLGELEIAAQYARQVEPLVGSTPSDDYWKTVSAAEVKLLLKDPAAAAALYRAGVYQAPAEVGNQESTYRQAVLLLDHLNLPAREREMVLAPFADLPSAKTERVDRRAVALQPAERAMVANLLFSMVARRHAAPDLLTSLEPARFWEAMRKVRPDAKREDLQSIAGEMAGPGSGHPSPLWLAWIQTVRSRDLDRLFE